MMNEELKKQNFKVIRLWENEIKKNPKLCVDIVKAVMN